MSDRRLYWDADYDIILALMAHYPDADIEAIGLQQLYDMIIALPEFADDPALVNNTILNGILRDWYEESTHQ